MTNIARWFSLSILTAAICGGVFADDAEKSAEDEPTPKVSPAVIAATKHAGMLQVELVAASKNGTLKLSERPILTFGDPARGNEAGTLWAWPTLP